MGSVEKGLGVLIETLSEFLQRLFEGNGNNEPNEQQLEKALKAQGNLFLTEALELPFSKLLVKIRKIDTKHLDRLVVYLYDTMLKDKINPQERLGNTIKQLIIYLDEERDVFSLDRNNIKNSLLHDK